MTALADMSAAGPRILDLLTASEAAVLLPGRCPVKKVRALAAGGVLTRVKLGAHDRYTPEPVAAYKATLTS